MGFVGGEGAKDEAVDEAEVGMLAFGNSGSSSSWLPSCWAEDLVVLRVE